jgi:branched-chain amino acid transport system ATP-binding protein
MTALVSDRLAKSFGGRQTLDTVRFVPYRPLTGCQHILSRAQGLREQWDLWVKRQPLVRQLSSGEQRQLEIRLVLAHTPQVILVGEPTAST